MNKTLAFHTSVNYQIQAPAPFNNDVHEDLLKDLARIKSQRYASDYDLHIDLSRTLKRLNDGHCVWINRCFDCESDPVCRGSPMLIAPSSILYQLPSHPPRVVNGERRLSERPYCAGGLRRCYRRVPRPDRCMAECITFRSQGESQSCMYIISFWEH